MRSQDLTTHTLERTAKTAEPSALKPLMDKPLNAAPVVASAPSPTPKRKVLRTGTSCSGSYKMFDDGTNSYQGDPDYNDHD